MAQPQHLLEDLTCGEIARHAIEPTGAKDAAHATTDLRADANSSAIALTDQHTFDLLPVGERQQQLLSTIGSLPVRFDRGCPKAEVTCQPVSQGRGQVRHPGKACDPLVKKPAAYLRGAVTR